MKKKIKLISVSGFLFKILLPAAIFVIAVTSLQGQDIPRLNKARYSLMLDSLKEIFGKDKDIPQVAETAFYAAISFYPELREQNIRIINKKIRTSMAARPASGSLFRHRSKRKYILFINNNKHFEGPGFYSLTFNQQTGIMGHELSHIADYMQKSSVRLIANGIAYISLKFRRNFENATDERTIAHGLGWPLYDFVYHLLHDHAVSEDYINKKMKCYYTDEQILTIINKLQNTEP